MTTYKDILNDNEIISIYKEIEKDKIFWADHSLNHINSVLKNIKNICENFNLDNKVKSICLIGGVLHDVGAIQGKQDHALRSYEFAKKYLERFDFSLEEKQKILSMIKNHSKIDFEDNLETKILVLADKCDITKKRVTKAGLMQNGIRQYAFIQDVEIRNTNNVLTINLNTLKEFDKKEFLEFYFTITLYNAIKSLALSLSVDYNFQINNINIDFV